jgi:hypothetical protein
MPLRTFTEFEKANLAKLTSLSIDMTLIQPTRTGLGKGILDATAPVRNFLQSNGLHNYATQKTGAKENGVYLDAVFVSSRSEIKTNTSLYRPEAKGKGGDPRIWFYGLGIKIPINPDDLIAMIAYEGGLICINITQENLTRVIDRQTSGPLLEYLNFLTGAARQVSDELLERLRALAASGPLPSVMQKRADTAIGRTLETALGIEINSRSEPDYFGIELKSFRKNKLNSRENRKQLFARVANWNESKFKSSEEILDTFGYQREDAFKLNCTISAIKKNSQGLSFEIDDRLGRLNERSDQKQIGIFATWILDDLRTLLAKKHNETFWIGATSSMVNGLEYFELKSVTHTRKPILSQFDILLLQGEITMDHMIKRNAKGLVRERGPSFKINSSALPQLFPPSVNYELN